MNISLIGKGGFAREIYHHLYNKHKVQIVNDIEHNLYNIKNNSFLICVGDVNKRQEIYNNYTKLQYCTYIDNIDNVLDNDNIIGQGSIICKGSILTTNIKLGIQCHINLNSTVGHDVKIGNFVTCSPGVNISGNCNIGNNVLIGTNASIKENINICDNVIIGMGSVVLKDITEKGIYFGNPLKKYK
jgi:sugar O-acyltransferase (sialic acid O-acetyltransferase NeuD family)